MGMVKEYQDRLLSFVAQVDEAVEMALKHPLDDRAKAMVTRIGSDFEKKMFDLAQTQLNGYLMVDQDAAWGALQRFTDTTIWAVSNLARRSSAA